MGNYRKETENRDIERTREFCDEMPEYITQYIRSIQFTTTPKTRLEYIKNIRQFFGYIIDNMSLGNMKDISPEILESLDKNYFEEYLDYLQRYEKDGRIYSNSVASVKRKLAALRNLYDYMFKSDLIRTNEILKIKIPKLRSKEIIRLENGETVDFINSVEGTANLSKKAGEYHEKQKLRDLAIVYLMLSTGIRVSECAGLNMNDVDFENCRVRVVRKGGNEAYVYFSDEAKDILSLYYDKRKRMHPLEEHKEALFLSSQHKRMNVRSIEYMVKKYARRSVPLKNISPHKLRSTYATALYKETSDIYLVAENLGHSDINTTRKHYADISNMHREASRNAVEIKKQD